MNLCHHFPFLQPHCVPHLNLPSHPLFHQSAGADYLPPCSSQQTPDVILLHLRTATNLDFYLGCWRVLCRSSSTFPSIAGFIHFPPPRPPLPPREALAPLPPAPAYTHCSSHLNSGAISDIGYIIALSSCTPLQCSLAM